MWKKEKKKRNVELFLQRIYYKICPQGYVHFRIYCTHGVLYGVLYMYDEYIVTP